MGVCLNPEKPKPDVIINELCPINKKFIPNNIINELSLSVCKISYENNNSTAHATGFFMHFVSEVKYRFLVTNYHVISEDIINKEIQIELHNKKIVPLKLDMNFLNINFFKESFDITTIQIDNFINDNINEIIKTVKFLDCDMNYLNGYEQYKNEYVLTSGYPLQQDVVTSDGEIVEVNLNNKFEFEHNMATDKGSSGSPIILLNNSKLIGVHKNANQKTKLNGGTFIGIIIDKLKEKIINTKNNEDIKKRNNQNFNDDNCVNQTKIEENNKSNNETNLNIYKGDSNKNLGEKKDKDINNNIERPEEESKKRNINDIYNIENKYEGDFKDGLKEGKGKEYYNNGDIYEGYFKKGLREGKGIYYWNEGDRYEGDFKNDKREGNGIMYYKSGNKYEGDFRDDKQEGKGKQFLNNGDIYEGDFKNNKREGKGIYYMNDGDRYEGDFKNGQREGKGIMHYKSGNKYEGHYKNDMPEGKGIYYWNDGDKYEGDFKNGQREGNGIMYYKSGNRYEGDFKNDKQEGKGIYCFKDGNRYEGDFKNGIQEGKGKFFFKNGDRYEGDFKNDKPEGKGIMYFKNGNIYEGDFKNGIPDGKGKIYHKDD